MSKKALRKRDSLSWELRSSKYQNHNNLAFHANLKCLLGAQNRYSCLKNCLCKLFSALSDGFFPLSPHRIEKNLGETDSITMLTTINSENKTSNIKINSF